MIGLLNDGRNLPQSKLSLACTLPMMRLRINDHRQLVANLRDPGPGLDAHQHSAYNSLHVSHSYGSITVLTARARLGQLKSAWYHREKKVCTRISLALAP
jgi:hypothetical protein